jgi:TolB-like protein/DNA-binding winged helix-turn-helix (wHTH) protein
MDVFARDAGTYEFGPFVLDPVRRALLRDGTPIKLSARLFDTLLYLVANHDRLVERDELQQAVWRGRAVEEGNLGQAISAVRKALQENGASETYIVTIPGRGFRFAAPVTFAPASASQAPASSAQPGPAPQGAAGRPKASLAPWHQPKGAHAAWAALAIAIVALGTALWHLSPADAPAPAGTPPFAPPPHSVAVLAFTNMSGDPAQTYFSDGLSEELIDSLSRLPQIQVAARMSAFSFKDKAATIDEIAHRLNVAAVLQGSVRRQGSHLRIATQLIDGRTGLTLWSAVYDPDPADLLNVQGEIATSVSQSLQVKLLGGEAAKLALGGTSNPRAFDAYLHGMQMIRAGEDDPRAYRKAVASFVDAIALDPAYAQARARHATALQQVLDTDDTSDVATAGRMENDALAEAERAVALAPDLPYAHAALGTIAEEARFDFRLAVAEVDRARDLAPSDFETNLEYADLHIHLGQADKAVAAAQLAVSLDPLTPTTYRYLAQILTWARRFTEARIALQHALSMLPRPLLRDRQIQGEIELDQHDYAGARRTCADAVDWQQLTCLTIADHALGRMAEAAADFAKLRADMGDTGAIQYAEIYAQWGKPDDALQWLEKAYHLHDPGMIEIEADPMLDPIRATPRFRSIEQQMNFPT